MHTRRGVHIPAHEYAHAHSIIHVHALTLPPNAHAHRHYTVSVATYLALNRVKPWFVHGKWVTALSCLTGVGGAYVAGQAFVKQRLKQINYVAGGGV